MYLRLMQVPVPLDFDQALLKKVIADRLKCTPFKLSKIEVVSRSIDSRSKQREPFYSLSVECRVKINVIPTHLKPNEFKVIEKESDEVVEPIKIDPSVAKVLVVGAGPAGLMATLLLAESGFSPIMIDRGASSEDRKKQVEAFWEKEELDTESNVLYGEGGAGLFSDGKLTARSKDNSRMNRFFEVLVDAGADPDIKIDTLPHVGSDKLHDVCPKIRQRILNAGGEIRFNTKLDTILFEEDGSVKGAVLNGEELEVKDIVLATGHSARDVFKMLYDLGVKVEAKAFAVGVRVEIPQDIINQSQRGKWCRMPSLGAASYKLTQKAEDGGRGCYSFCMCPGGIVIPCANEPGMVTSNGMSYDARDLPFSNSAFLVGVTPADFPKTDIPELAGIEFQRDIERKCYEAAGYGLAATRLKDFMSKNGSASLPEKHSFPNSKPANLYDILPPVVTESLRKAIKPMIKKLRTVGIEDVLIYAAETRSSSPVRVVRDRYTCEAENNAGLYPTGEGAGYSGGIVSSGIDGIRVAEALIKKYQQK